MRKPAAVKPGYCTVEVVTPHGMEVPMPSSLLFVNGTLMRGLELHANLDGAEYLETTTTSSAYRLYSIGDRHPGMFRVDSGGVAIVGELYRVPDDVLARVVANEPPDLHIGVVALADGRSVPGILYSRELAESRHRDISEYGGWRPYQEALGDGRRAWADPSG